MPKFMKMLNNISRSQSVYRADMLKVDGIYPHHHTFILAICRLAGCTQDELAKEICLNKSTVARTLNNLEEKGYVRREENSDDKRSVLVYPTDKMLEILPQVRTLAKNWNDLISKDIPKEELEMFFSVLSRIEEKAKEITASQENK